MKIRKRNLCFSVLVVLPVMQSTVVMAFPGQALFKKLTSNFTTAAFAGAGVYATWNKSRTYFNKKYKNKRFDWKNNKLELADNIAKVVLPFAYMASALSDNSRGLTLGTLFNALTYLIPCKEWQHCDRGCTTLAAAGLLAGAHCMPQTMHNKKFNIAINSLLSIARLTELDRLLDFSKPTILAGLAAYAYFGDEECDKAVSDSTKSLFTVSKFLFK